MRDALGGRCRVRWRFARRPRAYILPKTQRMGRRCGPHTLPVGRLPLTHLTDLLAPTGQLGPMCTNRPVMGGVHTDGAEDAANKPLTQPGGLRWGPGRGGDALAVRKTLGRLDRAVELRDFGMPRLAAGLPTSDAKWCHGLPVAGLQLPQPRAVEKGLAIQLPRVHSRPHAGDHQQMGMNGLLIEMQNERGQLIRPLPPGPCQ